MPAKLLYRDPQGRDAASDLPDGAPVFLGRAADCVVRTDDAMVSRKNCKITYAGGKGIVEDLGSSNGTFVNERRIQKQPLAHGDVIRCGTLQVRYVEVAPGAAPRPSSPSVIVQPETSQPSASPAAAPRRNTPQVGGGVVQVDAAALEATNRALLEQQESISILTGERDQSQQLLKEQAAELETLRSRVDANETELRRLRSEAVSTRDELAKAKRDAAQDKEELTALNRRASEMQQESKAAKEALLTLKSKNDELGEEVAARDRQLERAQEELHKTKQSTDELRAKLNQLQKTKDEGWRELNSQLAQVEHLREVIAEQERILEERRVGLIALESAAKDLRIEKEKSLRELLDTRTQRDDLKDKLARAQATIEGLEEEHRRLARVAGGGSAASMEEVERMSTELRALKVDMKKYENEKARIAEELERTIRDRDQLADERAKLEVERTQLVEDKKAAEAARARAEEARGKAEALRQQIDDERQKTAQARDLALSSSDENRRELERMKRRLADFEKVTAGAPPPATNADAEADQRARAAESRATALAAEIARLQAELERRAAAAPPAAAPAAVPSTDGAVALRQRAREVYDGINEALSEVRTTIITAKGLFGEVVGPLVTDQDARKALSDAIMSSMERTEDAKGILRTLKELAQE